MQQIVNAAPTPGEGDRVQGMISALVSVGVEGGYLANPRLARVHWQAGNRSLPAPSVSVAGESPLWVDPAEIPAAADVARLGQELAAGRRGDLDELMVNAAAYSGLHCSLVKPIVGLKRVGSGELAGGAAVLRNGSHRGRVITRSGVRGDCTTSPVEHRSASRPDDGRAGLSTCRRRVQS
jgi:hypothetical protein